MRFKVIKSTEAFTILELIITLALIVSLAVVAVPAYKNVLAKSITEADHASIVILNESTLTYAAFFKKGGDEDIFIGIDSDAARMQKLVDEQFLSKALIPRHEYTSFVWDVDAQFWITTSTEP